jgi:radical SAM protein with 4Fe4S-binding SPASM domain
MPEEMFRKIVDDLSLVAYKGILSPHSYGEPLADPRIVELMSYANSKLPHAKLVIYTSGDYLTPSLCMDLYKAGVSNYVVTQHGTNISPKLNKTFHFLKNNKKLNIRIDYKVPNSETAFSTRAGLLNIQCPINTMPLCFYTRNLVVVDYKGDVILCCNDYHGEVVFGNVLNESIYDIWNKGAFKLIRKNLRRQKYQLEICKKCVSS